MDRNEPVRSPKPGIAGSSPATPVSRINDLARTPCEYCEHVNPIWTQTGSHGRRNPLGDGIQQHPRSRSGVANGREGAGSRSRAESNRAPLELLAEPQANCAVSIEVPILGECAMQKLKLMLTAAMVLGAGVTATTNLAAAQGYVLTAADCAAPPPPSWRWYYTYYPDASAPNWGPFFRHHDYRYGPISVCPASATPPAVISSKY
jgi:hypothetical protein